MKYLYSFLDTKSGLLTPPTVMSSDAEAERSVLFLAMRSPDVPLIQFGADYTLFRIAQWDEEKGVEPFLAWKSVGNVEAIISRLRDQYKKVDKNEAQSSDSDNGNAADSPAV